MRPKIKLSALMCVFSVFLQSSVLAASSASEEGELVGELTTCFQVSTPNDSIDSDD
jgi:hypothetical protein